MHFSAAQCESQRGLALRRDMSVAEAGDRGKEGLAKTAT